MNGDLHLTPSKKDSIQLNKRGALPESYPAFLQELKQRIRQSQL